MNPSKAQEREQTSLLPTKARVHRVPGLLTRRQEFPSPLKWGYGKITSPRYPLSANKHSLPRLQPCDQAMSRIELAKPPHLPTAMIPKKGWPPSHTLRHGAHTWYNSTRLADKRHGSQLPSIPTCGMCLASYQRNLRQQDPPLDATRRK